MTWSLADRVEKNFSRFETKLSGPSSIFIEEFHTKGMANVGIGFIITISLLGALLGLFARQALSVTTEEEVVAKEMESEEKQPHFHAM
jgi:hypothetical protein